MKKYSLVFIVLFFILGCSKDDSTIEELPVKINLAPEIFKINVNNLSHNSAIITWDKAIDPENESVSYDVLLNQKIIVQDVIDFTCKLSDLTEVTNYTVEIVAKDKSGNKTSKTTSFTTEKYFLKYFKEYDFGPADYGNGYAAGYTYSIIKTRDGNYVIAGKSSRPNGNGYQFIVFKVDKDGKELWKKFYDYDSGDSTDFNIIESTNGLILAGWHEVLSLDNDGNLIWHKEIESYLGSFNSSEIRSVVQDAQGNIFLAGTRAIDSKVVIKEGVLTKLDNFGNVIWEKIYRQSVDNSFVDIKLTSSNELIILGTKETSKITYDDVMKNMPEQIDFWVLKVNSNGIIIWENTYGDGQLDFAQQIIEKKNGNYMFVGFCWGAYDISSGRIFEINTKGEKVNEITTNQGFSITSVAETLDGGIITVGNHYTDYYGSIGLQKYGNAGNEEWKKKYTIEYNFVVGQSVLLAEDGGFRVVGNSGKAIFGANERAQVLLYKTDDKGNFLINE